MQNRRLATVTAMTFLLGLLGAQPAAAMFYDVEPVAKTSAATSAAKTATVTCPAGKRVTGAGVVVDPPDGRVLIDYVRPDATLTSVTVSAHEDEGLYAPTWTITAYAMCAPAPAGLQLVAATSTSTSAAKGVTATCPAGKRLLGMGGGMAGADRQLLLNRMVPNAAVTSATVGAFEDETGTARNWTVTAYAICASPAQGVRYETRTAPYASGSPRSFRAPCALGETLVGMGGSVVGTGNQLVLQNVIPYGGEAYVWGSEDRTGFAGAWSVTAVAICGTEITRSAEVALTHGVSTYPASTTCGTGRHVTGTGAETDSGRGEVWFDDFGPNWPPDSAGITWHTETARQAAVIGFAFCTAPIPDVEPFFGGSQQRPDAPFKTTTTPCPAGKRLLSGSSRVLGGDGHTMLQAMVPSPDLSSVRIDVAETEAGLAGDWSLSAMALCAPALPGLQRVASTTVADSRELKVATATCPAGKHVVGTGAAVTPARGEMIIDDIRPNEAMTAVRVEAIEDRTWLDGTWSLSAYAVCASR